MATQTTIEFQPAGQEGLMAKTIIPGAAEIAESSGRPLDSSAAASSSPSVHEFEVPTSKLSTSRAWIVITQLCGINFISSFCNGLLTIGLPEISRDLTIPSQLSLWPNSVFYLTAGSCLLLAGSVADVLGPRRVNLPGAFVLGVFILACGLSRNGIDLIMFRALQGIANAMIMPSAVSIVSTNVEDGRPRNIGFASIFLAMPLGFALGLVLGGVFQNGAGWRVGFYAGGATGLLFFLIGIWALPADPKLGSVKSVMKRLATEIDWVGAGMASTALALSSYVLAILSADTSRIKDSESIGLLVFSMLLLVAFPGWMQFQQKRGRPSLIPNHIWKNWSFTSVCLMIMLANGVVNCMELFCSLFFQEVQLLSAIEASIRVLPQVLVGTALNFLAGVFVNKVPIMPAVVISSVLGAGAPLLMAIIDPSWSYWYCAFWAQILAPLAVDILFTVGTLVVSSAFPQRTQAIAGAVFSTFSQVGSSVGFCVAQVISSSVTAKSRFEDKSSPQALMKGYRATFWTLFAWMIATCVIGAVGLRKVGKVGVKRD